MEGLIILGKRSMKKMSQSDLAKAVGVSVTTIKNIENNRHEPKANLLKKICDTLEFDINEMWPKEDE